MEEFSFTPDAVQNSATPNDVSEFSFTPDDIQPDLSKVKGADVVYSKNPIDLLTRTAKFMAGRIATGGVASNPLADAALNVAGNLGKSYAENPQIIGEYVSSLPKTVVATGMELGKTVKNVSKAVSNKLDEQELYTFQKSDENDTIGAFGKELARGAASEIAVNTPKMASDLAFWLGTNMRDPVSGQTNAMADGFLGISETLKNVSDYMGNVEILKSQALPSLTGGLSWGQIGSVGGHGIGQGITMAVMARTMGAQAAYGFYALAGGGDVFKESYQKDSDLGKANTLATINASATYMVDRWFDPLPENIATGARMTAKQVSKEIGKTVVKEPLSEGLQQVFAENLVRKIGLDAEQDLFEGVIESMIGALGGAAAMGAASGAAAYSADRHYQEAKEKALQLGAEPSEVEQYRRATQEKLRQHPEAFDVVFQRNAEQTMQDINSFVKENGNSEEVRKALQTKAELEQVYTQVFDGLKKAGVNENVANADAKVWQGIALWGSQESGLSPLEYINQRMPKINSANYEQFQNRGKKLEEELDDYIPFQAMYRSKQPDFGSFYDDIVKNENTKDRYFTEDINGVGLDISRGAIFHDKDGHQLSKKEWLGVINALKANKIKQSRIGDYSKMRGLPVKMVVDVNSVEYGVVFEHMQSGRNLISTVFVLTDKGWINPKQKKRSQTEASEPLPQSRLLGNALPDIIAALDENVNKPLYQFAGKNKRDLVVQHATTLEKLSAALELGAMPMPSLAVTKSEYAGDSNFGEIVFIGGSDVIDPAKNRDNHTFSADIYSTRKISPVHEINKDGREYLEQLTSAMSQKGLYYWVENVKQNLDDGNDSVLKALFLASKSKITDLDGSTYMRIQNMSEQEKSDFTKWKRKFVAEYTDRKIFEGFTPSGRRKFSPYDLNNILRLMKKENLKASESTADGNAHALRGVWAEELKSIEEIRQAKGKIVDAETYKNLDNAIWDETIKLSDLLVTEQKAEELKRSWVAPDEYMIEEVLKKLKPNSNIKAALERTELRSDKKAVDAVKKYMELLKATPVQYFESKPQRVVEFSEFTGVIMPTAQEYDGMADAMAGYGLHIVRSDNRQAAIKEFENIFFQDIEAPKGAYMQNLDRNGVIYLFENADASTFMHETAHFFREELKGFNTARSRDMLQKMSEWENLEFDKRYKVKEENGRYVVTDKFGNVIYGAEKPFFDAGTAREYARNEIFARGFERYLREGKAPNNYLKQAFRSFWNWLRHLYGAVEKLDVDINDSIRSVYAEIIGGKDLDFYLTAPVDEVLQQHFVENEERKKEYDQQIALAQAQPVKRGFFHNLAQERTDGAKGRNEWWNKAVVPISTRAKRVNVKFRNKLRAYDYGLNVKLNQYYAQIKPFLVKWAEMTETDAIAFDLALKNSYVEKQVEIVNKYDAYDEFVSVKNLLNSLFDQATDVGIEMGYSADYFPRQIEDVEGFMAAIYGKPYASQLRRALKEADPDNIMTNEERAEFFNKYLRGFNRRDLNKPLPGNVKDRTIDIVTAEMNKYYKPSMQALISYIEGMNASIESRKFWGFKSDNIDQSIGALTADMIDKGLITPNQDAEVQAILKARFKAKGVTNKYLNFAKNVSYIYTMGGFNSAITQLDDLCMSFYKAGLWNTAQSVLSKKRPGLSREELGLEKIGQEFVEASASSEAVSRVFKLTLLDRMDAFGKNTLINATFNKFQEMAKNNEAELKEYLEPILEQETAQTIQDIKNGKVSENVKLLMFNELADVQPISLSEMPEWYLTSGNGRVFYMLKTFMIKRLDIFRNECFDKIRNGEVKTGMQNLFRLAIYMTMTGIAKDELINLLFGRAFDLTEAMVNNILGLAGISKYSLYKARDEGFSGFASSFLIPPLLAPEFDLLSDIYKSLFSKKGKDIGDYEIWKGVPLIGKFYYWLIGGGYAKEQRKKNKGKRLR